LQIFAAEFVLIPKMVVLDTELNSASNADIFKAGHRAKSGVSVQILVFQKYTSFFQLFLLLQTVQFRFSPLLYPKVLVLEDEAQCKGH
jgi:hypothetical protein